MPAEKILLRWMNFHLKKAGHKKTVSNFTTDVKVIVWLLSICGGIPELVLNWKIT